MGVNPDDRESSAICASGLVVRALSPVVSSWRATASLSDYLKDQGLVGISDVDTRQLTRLIRNKGVVNACLMVGEQLDEAYAVAQAKASSGFLGKDLTYSVFEKPITQWEKGSYSFESMLEQPKQTARYHVIVYDFGVKAQILRLLVDQGCRVTVLSSQATLDQILALNPDGVLLSNGPGDPSACVEAITVIRQLLDKEIPILGICLGFQLLALVYGAKTAKMPFGHHGANHPVKDIRTHAVFITSQNHGFSVIEDSLPKELTVTYRSLFDGTLQGFAHVTKPVFAFQGHPEASPGPHDTYFIFSDFIQSMCV